MSEIKGLNFSNTLCAEFIGWNFEGKAIRILADDIEDAQFDDVNNVIFVLLRCGQTHPTELRILLPSGDQVERLSPPNGFKFFSYLTRYPEKGVAAIYSADDPVDGWRDWHFFYDKKSRSLTKCAPAY